MQLASLGFQSSLASDPLILILTCLSITVEAKALESWGSVTFSVSILIVLSVS